MVCRLPQAAEGPPAANRAAPGHADPQAALRYQHATKARDMASGDDAPDEEADAG